MVHGIWIILSLQTEGAMLEIECTFFTENRLGCIAWRFFVAFLPIRVNLRHIFGTNI